MTSLLVLESDEPVPFSNDVTVALSKKTHADAWPPPMPDLPAEVQEFLAQIEFNGDDFTAPALPKELRTARRILRATVSRGVVRVVAFEIERGPNGIIAKLRKGAFAWPGKLAPPHSGFFVFVDDQGYPLAPPLPSPTPIVWSPVETRVLTNGDETCALIVPNVPLGPGIYRLVFEIDRRRWRAAAPNATSNYRASITIPLAWS